MTTQHISATYSPEDNKIRLYPCERLDDETFARVKAAGFKWAPRQELFVAPKWNVTREDLALELAGEILPEEMTLAERAQDKADRLEALSDKRAAQADAFQNAAREISARFAGGQPILAGHHSERKALKDKERMDAATAKAVSAHSAVDYWRYRACSVERHANHKNSPRTRARRIKTLLAELRDLQRRLNAAYKALDFWAAVTEDKAIMIALSNRASFDLWSKADKGEVTPQAARELCIKSAQSTIENPRLTRWINHTLNRLSYERELLGPVARFDGEISPVILQCFAREHGADKPKGAKGDGDLLSLECEAPLPAHIATGCAVEMTDDEWRDLMQACGYEVPAKKAAKPPIINHDVKGASIAAYCPHRKTKMFIEQVEMTKAEYAKTNSEQRGTRLSACGTFRIRICPNPTGTGPRYTWGWCTPLITDQKQHPKPEGLEVLEDA